MSSLGTRAARVVGATAAALSMSVVATLATAIPAAAGPVVYPSPVNDTFYSAPVDLGAYRPGDVLSVRPAPAPVGFVDTDVVQIRYRSVDSLGNPVAAVTTVLSPHHAVPGRPVLSYQHIINGLGLQCAPSQALYTQDPDLAIREAPALNVALQQGWTVAIPDHLGPDSAYGAVRLGAQLTLDGIRAVQRLPQLGLADSPVALAGYSGGGMTTAMAAALASTYAPELRIVGSAFGGAPLSIEKMARGLGEESHPAFGLAMAAALGLEREYPDAMPVTPTLNTHGLALRDSIANACTNGILAHGAGQSLSDVADADAAFALLDRPAVQTVLDANSVEQTPEVPTAPVYEWHASDDVLIPVDSITATLRRYCDAGVPVRSEVVSSPDHLSAAVIGLPGALQFLDDRFAGVPPTSTC